MVSFDRDFSLRGEVLMADKASKVITSIQGKMQGLGKTLLNTGSRLRSAGQSVTIGLTVPIVALGAAIIKTAGAFGDEMAKIIGLSNTSAEQVAVWREELLALAVTLGKKPQELAEGLFFLASAGLQATDALELLEIAGKASVAGLGDVETISLALTNVMNAYGEENIDAADAVGIMIAAVREGNLEVDTMAGTFGKLLPLASELDISFAEITGSMSALSLINSDANENATAFLGIMRALIKPSEAGRKVLERVGLTFDEVRASIREKGLLTTLQDLRGRLLSIEDVAKVFPRVRGLTALLNLTGESAEKVDDIFQAVAEGSSVDLAKAFDAAQTPAQRMRQIMARVQVALIRLDPVIDQVASVISFLVGGVEKLSDTFASLPGWAQKVVVIFALLVAAMGPLLIIIGAVIAAIGGFLFVMGAALPTIRAFTRRTILATGATLAFATSLTTTAIPAGLAYTAMLQVMTLGKGGMLAVAGLAIAAGFAIFTLVKAFRKGKSEGEKLEQALKAIRDEAEVLGLDEVVEQGEFLARTWLENEQAISSLLVELDNLSLGGRKFQTSMGRQTAAGVVLVKQIDDLRDSQTGLVESLDKTGIQFEQQAEVARLLEVPLSDLTDAFPELGDAAETAGTGVDGLEELLTPAGQAMDDYTEQIEDVANALSVTLVDAVRGLADIETEEEVRIQSNISRLEAYRAEILRSAGVLEDDLPDAIQATIDKLDTQIGLLDIEAEALDTAKIATGDWLATLIPGLLTFEDFSEVMRITAGHLSEVETQEILAAAAGGILDQALDDIAIDPTLAEEIRAALETPLFKANERAKELLDTFNQLGSGIFRLTPSGDLELVVPGFQHGGVMPQTGLALLHAGETVLPANQSGVTLNIGTIALGGRATEADAEEFLDMVETRLRARRIRFG